ncbi:Type I phosphodiesterase / nucleotide pyrophosphatase [Halogranum amylolyticum]|uniref:Type I phosphodiesterase / nucleotide pyrophosphatase n=1 Tax=Halogranum amylolyticum TaxID=660520 RepID=A0A1H8SUW9_9EURY|nr:alkaline phosphatase family protein [Halogranum amylolyticum]SEO82148.1 Type I phosphodiesterase / nucleotide pyrophosphatase [Halogranum amylolyticum]
MTDTIAVLALDAADVRLAREWDCANLLLDDHAKLESYAHTLEFPRTMEVWPTVATGLGPDDHGVVGDANEWEHPALRAASKLTQYLPREVRSTLGRPFQRAGQERSMAQTDASHLFESGVVRYWPGITPADHVREAWRLMAMASGGDITEERLRRELVGFAGEELGWLAVASEWDVPVAGVHSHVVDIMGHTYAEREKRLRETYEWIDREVGFLRERVDRLVVLSDHGMQVGWLDDENPGTHSFEALVAAEGVDGPLPESVYDVREWLEAQFDDTGATDADDTAASSDTPVQHLRDLGYME